jgi:hypothetical protein
MRAEDLRPAALALAAILLPVACAAPQAEELPAGAEITDEKTYLGRVYSLLPGVPAVVETRCLLVDDRLLRNPHFEPRSLRLAWGRGDPLPPWTEVVDVRIAERGYAVWIRPDGEVVGSSHGASAEEELGKVEAQAAAQWAGLDPTALVGRRFLLRPFLHARLRVAWDGRRGAFLQPTLTVAPYTRLAELALSFDTRASGKLAVKVPWEAPCYPPERGYATSVWSTSSG